MTNNLRTQSLFSVAALALVIGAGAPALAQEHQQQQRGRTPVVINRSAPVARHAPPVVVSRQVITPRVVARGPSLYRSVSPVVVVGRGAPRRIIGPRVSIGVAPVRFYRPYYAFRPRLRIGAGFFIGFPVAYSFGYYDPYYYSAYGYPYSAYPSYAYPSYGYPVPAYPYPAYPAPAYPYSQQAYPQSAYPSVAPGTVVAQPGQANTGGASFEISPSNADVLVDGVSMGPASQFSPTTAPLGLTPGHHHFEIRAAGYQTITFDADIVAGQVTPFQGTLER